MGYEPKINKNDLGIKCPLLQKDCIQEKCAWWMYIQRACAVNVIARDNIFTKNNSRGY